MFDGLHTNVRTKCYQGLREPTTPQNSETLRNIIFSGRSHLLLYLRSDLPYQTFIFFSGAAVKNMIIFFEFTKKNGWYTKIVDKPLVASNGANVTKRKRKIEVLTANYTIWKITNTNTGNFYRTMRLMLTHFHPCYKNELRALKNY